ncbi:hypothetical protein DdX_01190 [Ditylenchus destructor]|uniref:Uncharacterized protein n=1 Tax=Ditylenchus destructor TaxID=166010 RepID=A0AAD4RDQ8_9BILA|nr:hypothetical protein DdX_01190 [Ditylenchus destructor]
MKLLLCFLQKRRRRSEIHRENVHSSVRWSQQSQSSLSRTARVTNSERQISKRQISKLVSSYAELERVNRQRLPYLQTIQHHLGKFYTPVAAANNDSEENEESLIIRTIQILKTYLKC